MNKKVLFGILVCSIISSTAYGQNPTYEEKLFYTCKVWGFVKYYHSEVSNCAVNWDSVLIANLPVIKNAVTFNDFNDALDSMLYAAGPMAIATSPPLPVLPPELCRNANFTWINSASLRTDVQATLNNIQINFRPHPICNVKENDYTTSYIGLLMFPGDNPILDSNLTTNFPNEFGRLDVVFRYWNIINYFNPYNYVLDVPWDSTLYNNILLVANAPDAQSFYKSIRLFVGALNDAHAEGLTYDSGPATNFMNFYVPRLILVYSEGKYIVVKSQVAGISRGDEIKTVDGYTTAQREDSLRQYISAGNPDVFHRFMCQYLLGGTSFTYASIGYIDSLGNSLTTSVLRGYSYAASWFYTYYPNDTLAGVKWRLWSCNVGYVNMGNLLQTDVNSMYNALQNTSSIIFDLRNYPNGTFPAIADKLYPQSMYFSKIAEPDVTYPGTYYWFYDPLGNGPNPTAYSGKVIILVNEQTQSQAEFTCMGLEAMPDATVIGSQTAGADGNVSYFNITQDMYTGFTSLGIYYPNGDSTQRIGIVPDSVIYPTQLGIRQHRDEVLEKAMEVTGCWTGVTENATQVNNPIECYPNPSTSLVNVNGSGLDGNSAVISLTDVSGKIIFTETVPLINGNLHDAFDMSEYAGGIYFLVIQTSDSSYTKQIVR